MLLPPPPPVPTIQVPFYSQFTDISFPEWRGKSCGIASLAMILEYYKPASTSVDRVLSQGLAEHGYIEHIGWTYKSLIAVANKYGLIGESYDLKTTPNADALAALIEDLSEGPVIVSVHYKFDPLSIIPHLVVADEIQGDTLYYNDPAAGEGEKKISVAAFLKAWKKRFIVIRPADKETAVVLPS